MSWLVAAVEWQSRAVVARHLRVYLRNWHTAFLPPALEPVTMLVAFGVGLGGYVASLTWQGRPVEYTTYIAPGLLAYATFMTSIFQSLFAAFIRAGKLLGEAAATNRLDRGLRATLAQIVIFHWNRLGLSASAQGILAHAAKAATLPRR